MVVDPFAFVHHAAMLSDKPRLTAYKEALAETLLPLDSVVDIGCGTGVLAAMASEMTSGPVVALEYFESAAAVARNALQASGFPRVRVVQASSYDTQLEAPTVVVTETIGQFGPEENIVELCWDFVRRHPSIRALIPSRLRLCSQFGYSKAAHERFGDLWRAYQPSDCQPLDFSDSRALLMRGLCKQWFYSDISDLEPAGTPVDLAAFELGVTASSSFEAILQCPAEANILHLYFEAQLSESVSLDSSFRSRTHWGHMWCFIPRPGDRMSIRYVAQDKRVEADVAW